MHGGSGVARFLRPYGRFAKILTARTAPAPPLWLRPPPSGSGSGVALRGLCGPGCGTATPSRSRTDGDDGVDDHRCCTVVTLRAVERG